MCPMIEKIELEHKTVKFSQINLVPFAVPDVPELTFSCHTYPPDRNGGVLTRDCAFLLLKLHPLILWDKNYCILGRRTLHLVAPILMSDDEINVGFLKTATKEQAIRLMTIEPLVNQIAFATPTGGKGIFETSRSMNKQLVASVSQPLTQPVEFVSKMFSDCGVSTLFKLNASFK